MCHSAAFNSYKSQYCDCLILKVHWLFGLFAMYISQQLVTIVLKSIDESPSSLLEKTGNGIIMVWKVANLSIANSSCRRRYKNSEQFVAVTAPPPLYYPIDVVFVVDESASVGSEDFTTIKLFLSQLVSRLDIDRGNTRVGLITFATNVVTVFNLNAHSSVKSLKSAISSLSFTGGGTSDTAAALAHVRTRMLTEAAGDRDNVHNIVIIITDGRANNFNATVVSIKFHDFFYWNVYFCANSSVIGVIFLVISSFC